MFDYIRPSEEMSRGECKRILSNLALVCHFFCAVSLSRLFSSLEFSGASHKDSNSPGYASLCRSIIKDQEPARSLARHVKECTFKEWKITNDTPSWVLQAFLGIYGQAITRMPNLKTLTLSSTFIDKRLLNTICKLKQLKSLSFSSCSFSEDLNQKDFSKFSFLTLTSFKSCGDFPNGLSPGTSQLQDVQIERWTTAHALLREVHPNHLTQLQLHHVEDMATLCHFLNEHPSISVLHINTVLIQPTTTLPLLASSIPNLHTLICPPTLISTFIPGRPLTKILLSSAQGPDETLFPFSGINGLEVFKQATGIIRCLEVPAGMYHPGPFNSNFPELEELCLDFRLDMEYDPSTEVVLAEVCWDLPQLFAHLTNHSQRMSILVPAGTSQSFLALRKLRFILGSRGPALWNLQLHYNLISTWTQIFPKLCRVSFTEFVQWRMDLENKTWKAFVPHEPKHYNFVTRHIRAGQDYTDYGGCFETVLHGPNLARI